MPHASATTLTASETASYSELLELGLRYLSDDERAAFTRQADIGEGADIELALTDLVADANGDIVLHNDSNFRSVTISSSEPVVNSGIAEARETDAGVDVEGLRFVQFMNGTTLFYHDGFDLIINAETL
ncbi:MAG: hypothetical protein ACFB3T_09900 [Geminicoccaceae bacterium]